MLDRRDLVSLSRDLLAGVTNATPMPVPVTQLSLNALKVARMRHDPKLRHALAACDVLSPDGMGVVWAARLLGHDIPERVTGIDLMLTLMPGLAAAGARVCLLGARPEIIEKTARNLKREYPGLIIAGMHHGYVDDAILIKTAKHCDADVVFVALPSPRKERFVVEHARQTGARLLIAVGGAFDVIAGEAVRAPQTWQRAGFEWLWRIGQNPRAMAGRYLRGLPEFGFMIGKALLQRQVRRFSRLSQRIGLAGLFLLMLVILVLPSAVRAETTQTPTSTKFSSESKSVPDTLADLQARLESLGVSGDLIDSSDGETKASDNGNRHAPNVIKAAQLLAVFFETVWVGNAQGSLSPDAFAHLLTNTIKPDDQAANGVPKQVKQATPDPQKLAGRLKQRRKNILALLNQAFRFLISKSALSPVLLAGIQGFLVQVVGAILIGEPGGEDPAQTAALFAPDIVRPLFDADLAGAPDNIAPTTPGTSDTGTSDNTASESLKVTRFTFVLPVVRGRSFTWKTDVDQTSVDHVDDDFWREDSSPR
jgi:exopolysaccharide biosynthesis WecB/TagA/CpsF family protein